MSPVAGADPASKTEPNTVVPGGASPAKVVSARAKATAFSIGLFVSFGLAEAAMRLPGIPRPLDLENYVGSCYERDASDPILRYDTRFDVYLPRVHVTTRCAFNGYVWRHRSDQLGFRNPRDVSRADVAVLGDSMVYGHGVEESDTAAALLRRRYAGGVANLGVVGASPVHSLLFVRNVVNRLNARVVVVFFYRNDILDIRRARTEVEVRRFVETGDAREARTLREPLSDDSYGPGSARLVRLASRSAAFRALRFGYLVQSSRSTNSLSRRPRMRRNDPLIRAYLERSIIEMHGTLASSGRSLVVATMPTSLPPQSNGAHATARIVEDEVHRVAVERGIPYFDPSERFRLASGRPDPRAFLRRDFHLSREGHRRLSDALDEFLVSNHVAVGRTTRDTP